MRTESGSSSPVHGTPRGRERAVNGSGRRSFSIPAWARALFSVSMLVLLFSRVELGGVGEVLLSSRLDLLGVLVLMFAAERTLAAYRWHLLVRTQSRGTGFGATLRATFVSGFVGSLLPGAVGMEATRVVVMKRLTSNLSLSVVSVALDRLLGALALTGIVVAALYFAPEPLPGPLVIAAWAALGVVVVALASLQPGLLNRIGRRLPENGTSRLGHGLAALVASLSAARQQPRVIAWVAVLSLVFQGLRVGIAPVAALALNLHVPLPLYLIYWPIVIFLMMLPISVAGLGVREAGLVFFFGAEHMSPEAALSLGLLIGALSLISQLPGAWFLIAGVRTAEERGATGGAGQGEVGTSSSISATISDASQSRTLSL